MVIVHSPLMLLLFGMEYICLFALLPPFPVFVLPLKDIILQMLSYHNTHDIEKIYFNRAFDHLILMKKCA